MSILGTITGISLAVGIAAGATTEAILRRRERGDK